MNTKSANLQSAIKARPPWTKPIVRDLFYSEANDRRWECEEQPALPTLVPQRRELVVAPRVAADQRLADALDKCDKLAADLALVFAEVRAIAAGEASADDELISVAEVAAMMGTTKDAARKQLKRAGVDVKSGGRLYAPRTALATLYVRNVQS
jgi:hypothetical protein